MPHRRSAASLLLLALAAGCASAPGKPPAPVYPGQASIEEELVAEATVVSVDRATRGLVLERSDGARLAMTASTDVRNYDRIEPGMKLKARVGFTLTVRKLQPEEADIGPDAASGAARAKLGEKPRGGIASGLALTVKVESVDPERHVVTFVDPEGALRAVMARRDEGKRFVEGLMPGDRVAIVYVEGLILSVE